jgi:hypothetical protein
MEGGEQKTEARLDLPLALAKYSSRQTRVVVRLEERLSAGVRNCKLSAIGGSLTVSNRGDKK